MRTLRDRATDCRYSVESFVRTYSGVVSDVSREIKGDLAHDFRYGISLPLEEFYDSRLKNKVQRSGECISDIFRAVKKPFAK